MKKLLLSLATALCMSSAALATEVTINLNSSTGFTGGTDSYTATTEGFTFTYAKASSTTDCVAPSSDHIRVYKDASFTVKAADGVQITKMVFTGVASNVKSMTVGETTYNWSSTSLTWEGNENEVVFNATGGQSRIKSVAITYVAAGAVVVEKPTFSIEGGIYSEAQTVAITAGDGCSIFYTIDGQTPTDDVADGSTIKYVAPIAIDKTTTVKAIAFDAAGNQSDVAVATYTIVSLLEGAEGDGTEAAPYNAVGAYNAALMGSTATVFVKGIVVSIKEISTQYGNATYYISADGTETNQLYIYRGYSINGDIFTAEDEIKVGDVLVINGNLKTYNGVPQINTGSKIISINGETPDPEPDPYEFEGAGTELSPYTVADVIGINPTSSSANEDYPDKYWVAGYIVGRCDGQAYEPVFNAEAPETGTMQAANIILAPNADCTDKSLCIPVQLVSSSKTREALNLVDNPDNIGKYVVVYGNIYKYFGVPGVKNTSNYKLDASGVDAVEIDANAAVEYYNLQGVRVAEPTTGLYIVRQGDKVTKQVIR